jgi:hypothetical protein
MFAGVHLLPSGLTIAITIAEVFFYNFLISVGTVDLKQCYSFLILVVHVLFLLRKTIKFSNLLILSRNQLLISSIPFFNSAFIFIVIFIISFLLLNYSLV